VAEIVKIWHGVPPISEQRAIAAFLDRETAKIDALVEKKERLISLLQEKRTALISHAVTKGLDPTVPMKDSGVEWLGDIPAHWEVRRADSFLRYEKIQIEPSEIWHDVVFHYSIPAVQETGDGVLESPAEIDSSKLRVVGKRLLVSKLNPRKGVVVVAVERDVPTICSSEFVPFEVRRCDLRWAMYLFLAEPTRQRLSAVVRSATRSHQRAEVAEIVKIWHGVPPISEQRAIAAFLDRETAKIDALIAKVREAIERLKEYRTALISAAVTGKIKTEG
jgi:restriction endonuclease S subunit